MWLFPAEICWTNGTGQSLNCNNSVLSPLIKSNRWVSLKRPVTNKVPSVQRMHKNRSPKQICLAFRPFGKCNWTGTSENDNAFFVNPSWPKAFEPQTNKFPFESIAADESQPHEISAIWRASEWGTSTNLFDLCVDLFPSWPLWFQPQANNRWSFVSRSTWAPPPSIRMMSFVSNGRFSIAVGSAHSSDSKPSPSWPWEFAP